MVNPEKILVIQLRRLGDVIFTLPVIHVLRRNFPGATIDFLVEKPSEPIARLDTDLSETLTYDGGNPYFWIRKIRKRKYDWVLDFHSNGRTLLLTAMSGAKVRAGFSGPITRRLAYNRRAAQMNGAYIVDQKLSLLKSLGLDTGAWSWSIQLPGSDIKWAGNFLGGLNGKGKKNKLVGLAPASRRETRLWISERWSALADYFLRNSCDVIFLYGHGEKELIDAIAGAMKLNRPGTSGQDEKSGRVIVPPDTTFLQLSALIRNCALVVSVDNGPKNMAVALGVPTVSIDGPTNPLSFNPHGDPRHIVIRDEKLFCIACELNICPYRHECMQNVTVEAVIAKAQSLMDAGAPQRIESVRG